MSVCEFNAAGAWADVVGQMAGAAPIGLVPRRRTAFTFPPPPELDLAHLPAVMVVDESFYLKPDAGQRRPGAPARRGARGAGRGDGHFHIEQLTTLQIRRPSHSWAGLRSFVPDGDLVVGWDGTVDGLLWVAAQGGYGIQSAPGYALLARNLALGEPLDAALTAEGVAALSPQRLR